MLTANGLDFTVNPQKIVNQDIGMFVIITMIVETIQMKFHKSLTVVSEALSFLYKMISWNIASHIIFIDFWKTYGPEFKSNDYCNTSKDYSGRHPKFGFAILSPVFLSTIFVLVHWWKTESNLLNKLLTLPLVIGQMWPQYRIIRILYFGLIKQNRKWKVENEDQKKNVSSLGMFWIWSDDTSFRSKWF